MEGVAMNYKYQVEVQDIHGNVLMERDFTASSHEKAARHAIWTGMFENDVEPGRGRVSVSYYADRGDLRIFEWTATDWPDAEAKRTWVPTVDEDSDEDPMIGFGLPVVSLKETSDVAG
jgi:hypothetical protein